MFKRLLVPLDGTPESVTALPLARTIGVDTDATLTLFRAVPAGEQGGALALDHARRYLAGVTTYLVGTNADHVASAVRQGEDIATTIVAQASASASDLIVMATHARHGLARVAHESVAMQVLRLSPLPLLLVAPGEVGEPRLRTILAPVDGTPAGESALESVVALAQASGAEIVLLRIVAPTPVNGYDPLLGDYAGADVRLDFDRADLLGAQHYVDECVGRLRAFGVKAQGFAAFGGASDAILEYAERIDADLIAMSTHALSGMARATLGSVADVVLQQAHRPLLLVRRDTLCQRFDHDHAVAGNLSL